MTDPMITMHGREGKPGLTTALAASGLLLFCLADARPANACHIKHEDKTKSSTTGTTSTSTSDTSSMTPEEKVQQAFTKLLHDIPAQTSQPMIPAPAASTISTSSTATSSAPMAPALPQILLPTPASSTPSVANWHQNTPNTIMPPTPPAMCDGSSTSGSQSMMPPSPGSPLKPPASFLTPTAAPEPSILLMAGVLAGAFAWRRRLKSK
jgi:MYXO-CTERM domain-containing protein